MAVNYLVLAGAPRLAVLNAAGVVQKTLALPPPKKGDGLALEFLEKGVNRELEDFSESGFTAGYIAKLTLKWEIYDETAHPGVTLGTADGNRPTLKDLLGLTSGQVRGLLRVSPGPSGTGGFRVERVTTGALGLAGASYGRGVALTFWGKDLLATEALQDWV